MSARGDELRIGKRPVGAGACRARMEFLHPRRRVGVAVTHGIM
jgi:hypothetical protein